MVLAFPFLAFPQLFQFLVSLEFYSSVLKPDFNLSLGQVQFLGDFLSFFSNNVVIAKKAFLESLELFRRKCCARPFLFGLEHARIIDFPEVCSIRVIITFGKIKH